MKRPSNLGSGSRVKSNTKIHIRHDCDVATGKGEQDAVASVIKAYLPDVDVISRRSKTPPASALHPSPTNFGPYIVFSETPNLSILVCTNKHVTVWNYNTFVRL